MPIQIYTCVHAEDREREGFPITSLREMNILSAIDHPYIVGVKEIVVGTDLNSIFMVMEIANHDLCENSSAASHHCASENGDCCGDGGDGGGCAVLCAPVKHSQKVSSGEAEAAVFYGRGEDPDAATAAWCRAHPRQLGPASRSQNFKPPVRTR